MFDFQKISNSSKGEVIAQKFNGPITTFLTDSRNVVNPRASVFVAIQGPHHDGHHYIQAVYNQGVRNFIIEHDTDIDAEIVDNSNILYVQGSIASLQLIASAHRSQFEMPVVGITGSNGKTIVKEWLGQLLSDKYKVVKSPKSYNSQLGVPLSVLQITRWNDFGIFEAGISTVSEMAHLQKVIKPNLGIFTNIGPAHDEGFKDQSEKAKEKWQLFANCDCVICCADHQLVVENKPHAIPTFYWGNDDSADLQIESIVKLSSSSLIKLISDGATLELKVPFIDIVSIENVMHCIALMCYLGIPQHQIQESLFRLTNIDHRLSLKKGINNCYLVDDSYNNDLTGLQNALDFLKGLEARKKIVILSDVLQSGLSEPHLIMKINEILQANSVAYLIGIGEVLSRNSSLIKLNGQYYRTTEDFLEQVEIEDFQNQNILIKGARPFQFERITTLLSEKVHGTVLEINLEALNSNLNFYRSKLQQEVKLMVMVKAFAYGSGSHEVANLLQHNRVDYLAVAYPDEGVELRKRGIYLPIMVMNVAPESFGNIIKYDLEPEVYSLQQLLQLQRIVNEKSIKLKIHLKIDSGMHRLGFEQDNIHEAINILRQTSFLEVASIYSHLAGADDEAHNVFTRKQVKTFLQLAEQVEKQLDIQTLKHILNSAGIIRFPEYQLDMVRLGIGLYGFESNEIEQGYLQPISTLKTVISQIRTVSAGETIGYGRQGLVSRDSKIATIAIGYADGFSRAFSNGKISLMVNDKMAPVIGNVCMDMTMLDITGIEAKEGDEVIVFGGKPTIIELAKAIGTIPYEILTSISNRVTRVFFSG